MNYELAKQLKDAGFPQKAGRYLLDNGVSGTTDRAGSPYRSGMFIPTLSELIEACGHRLVDLTRTYNGWGVNLESSTDNFMSKTPEEAVAKLWLDLK